jgi:phage head maturation protease
MPSQTTVKTAKRERALAIRRDTLSEEARTVEAVFATEAPIESWGWEIGEFREVLDCRSESFIGGRFEAGAQFLKEHNRELVVGVIESYRFEKGQGIATLRYAETPLGEEEWTNMRTGIRKNFSVSYHVRELQLEQKSEGEAPTYRATSWEGLEISVVSVPADPQCKALRSEGGQNQRNFTTKITHMATQDDNFDPAAERAKLREEERAALLNSAKEITASAASFRAMGRDVDDLAKTAGEEGWTADKFRAEAEKLPIVSTEERAKIAKEERAKIIETQAEINASAECLRAIGVDLGDLVTEANKEGWSAEKFRAAAEVKIKEKAKTVQPTPANEEQTKRSGLTGLARAMAAHKAENQKK